MVAKMLLLAASASVALASASARTLAQENGVAFAAANQYSTVFSDENQAVGTTEADTLGPDNEAYAEAEGLAEFTNDDEGPNFAAAETVATSFATNLDGLTGVPDAQSIALSSAIVDNPDPGVKTEAYAEATSEAAAEFIGGAGLGSGNAQSRAIAAAPDFGGASTLAKAYGTNNADSFADSLAVGAAAGAESEAESVAVGGDADAQAISISDSIQSSYSGPEEETPGAKSSSDASALVTDGGASNARAFSFAGSDADAEADAVATADSRRGAFNIRAGAAQSRATSLAGVSVPDKEFRGLEECCRTCFIDFIDYIDFCTLGGPDDPDPSICCCISLSSCCCV